MVREEQTGRDQNFQNESTAHPKSGLEHYFRDNQNILLAIGVAIIIIIGGIVGYRYFYVQLPEQEAKEQIFMAQNYWAQDSLDLALKGDQTYPGFEDIADEYSQTPTGNLAKFYTGIIYLKKGQYEEALDYLKDFSTESKMMKARKMAAIGDAYSQMKDYEAAAEYYEKAANAFKNDISSPRYHMKAGKVYEHINKLKKARDQYEAIKEKYPESPQAEEVDKYLARVNAKIESA